MCELGKNNTCEVSDWWNDTKKKMKGVEIFKQVHNLLSSLSDLSDCGWLIDGMDDDRYDNESVKMIQQILYELSLAMQLTISSKFCLP